MPADEGWYGLVKLRGDHLIFEYPALAVVLLIVILLLTIILFWPRLSG